MSTDHEKPKTEEPEVLASWSYHPLVESPLKSVLLGLGLLVAWVTAYLWFQGWGLGMAIILTVWPLAGYIFPTRYKLTDTNIEARNFISIQNVKWSRFAGYSEFPDAIQLYYDTSDLRGRMLRGVLLFYNENGPLVHSIVDQHVEPKE